MERGLVMTFEDWWRIVIKMLDRPCRIKNWTAKTREYNGEFVACSLRSLPDKQRRCLYGYPFPDPDKWIVCNQVKASGLITVPKHQFGERYETWRSYKDERIIRKDFNASPYVISIFRFFDRLFDLNDDEIVTAVLDYLAARKSNEGESDALESK